MTVSTISSNAANLARSVNTQDNKVKNALGSIASGSRFSPISVDVSGLAESTQLQANAATLFTTSLNIAQSSALSVTAQSGAEQISDGLDRLEQLATEASSSTLSSDDRTALNTEFQSVRQEINSIATGTQFNGQNLLDGSLAASGATASGPGTPTLAFGNLTDNSLFSGSNPDLLSASNAQAALSSVAVAQATTATVQTAIASTSEALDFTFASNNVALENQQAAVSTLSDTDIGAASTEASTAITQQQFSIAAAVQGNRLHVNILDLLKE